MGRLQCKQGRPSKYRNSLKSDYWIKVKNKIRLRDDFQCRCCNSTIRLETHHITYFINGQSITGNELQHLKWLILLCETCHQKVHDNINHSLNPKNRNKINANNYRSRLKKRQKT